jgi:hypothetical protein
MIDTLGATPNRRQQAVRSVSEPSGTGAPFDLPSVVSETALSNS